MLYLSTRVGFSTMVLTAIDRLLVKEKSLWWQGRDKGELIRRAAEKLDREPPEPWGVTNGFHFINRFFDEALVGRALGFSTGEMCLPGCHATPFQGHLLQSRPPRNDVCPLLSFRHRHEHRRSLDQSARRPQREPRFGLVQERHPALAQRPIQTLGPATIISRPGRPLHAWRPRPRIRGIATKDVLFPHWRHGPTRSPRKIRQSEPADEPQPLAPAAIVAFRRRLIAWYRRHARDLPWRRTRDPYRVWISEIMLQQTQVATVIPYYERFLARFPDVAALGRRRRT